MWRQGDVFIASVKRIPPGARPKPDLTLVEGEITGHAHRVAGRGTATIYRNGDALFLDVTADSATITHEEHDPIGLRRGTYGVWRQREYTPAEIRVIRD